MTQALVPTAGRAVAVVPGGAGELTPPQYDMYTQMAAMFQRSQAYSQYKSTEHIFLAMMTLREMGVSPVVGLQYGYQTPNGKLAFEVKVMLASVQGRCPSFEYEPTELTDEKCVVRGRMNATDKWTEAEFTIEQAKKAGLVKDKSAWMTYPKDQLLWKAIVRLLRRIAGPVLFGAPLPQPIEDALREENEISHAVVIDEEESGAGNGGGTSTTAERQDGAATSAPEKEDREKFNERAKAMGYRTADKVKSLVNLLMTDLGMTPVNKPSELGKRDWTALWKELDARYDEAGKPRPKTSPAPDPQSTPVATGNAEESPTAGLTTEPSTGAPARPVPPTPPPAPPSEDPLEPPYMQGDPQALMEFALFMQGRTGKTLLQSDADGRAWFVYGDILSAVGSTRFVDGKPAPLAVILHTPVVGEESFVASTGMCREIALKVREFAEGAPLDSPRPMTARADEALKGVRG